MKKNRFVFFLIGILIIIFANSISVFADTPVPGDPPLVVLSVTANPSPTPLAKAKVSPNASTTIRFRVHIPLLERGSDETAVNISSRHDVLDFYQNHYMANTSTPINWTGSHTSCAPGTTSTNFQQAVLERINYFRAMAGVPASITFSADTNRKAQNAALMMSAAGQLSHSPASSWACYSPDGASAAGSSDLYLGEFSWNAITGYIRDPGAGNEAAGHRRWILYPQTQLMGTGDVPSSSQFYAANSLVIFDEHMSDPRPATREAFVAWPPAGYVPAPIVFPRWSFSYAQADFSAASVQMRSNGADLPVKLASVANGYGENTLVWVPLRLGDWDNWPKIIADTTYSVTVSNVIINGASRSFSYYVTVFNP